jgi:hypothetical protein
VATLSTSELDYFADEWEKIFPSAVCSGIVGDLAHKKRGGYHISIEDQPSTNFSVTRKDDKAPPGDWPRNRASAVDMSMNKTDMKLCHTRLRNLWKNRATDPRAKYINCFNGWDGTGTPGRYDMVDGSVEEASKDHEWHEHLERKRKYWNSRVATNAILSALRGETLAEYLGEDDLPVEQVEFDKLMRTYVNTHLNSAVEDEKLPDGGANRRLFRRLAWNLPTTGTDTMYQWMGAAAGNSKLAVQILTSFIADEAARDAAEAVRDAGTTAALKAIQDLITHGGTSGAITDAQMTVLIDAIRDAAQGAAEEAGDAANKKVERLMQVLASAGDEMGKADDTLTPPSTPPVKG